MAGNRLSILARFQSVRRSPTDRHGRTTISFGTWGVLIAILFAASVANGQETGNLSAWQSGELAQESVPEGSGAPMESVMPGVSTPAGLQRLPVLEDAFATPRNDVLEIVQRRDDYAVRRHRKGFLQRFRFSGGWLDQGGQNDLGIGNLKTSLTCAIPLGSFENLLLITPGFEATSLSGAAQIDAPSQLYDVGVDFMWRTQLNDRWGAMVVSRGEKGGHFRGEIGATRKDVSTGSSSLFRF